VLSNNIIEQLTNAVNYFKNSVRSSAKLPVLIDNSSLMSLVQQIVLFMQIIKTYDSFNYPTGQNSVIENIPKTDFEFFHIRQEINRRYGCEKTIEYIDSKHDKFTVNSQDTLNYAILNTAQQVYENHMQSFRLMQEPIPTHFSIPMIEVCLIVTTVPGSHMLSVYNNDYTDVSSQFVSYKDIMLKELRDKHNISLKELEGLYVLVCRATRGRRPDGILTRTEFRELMENKFSNVEDLEDFFNAVDENKKGFVEFRSLVAAISVLKNGVMEQRLILLFNAFSRSEKGVLTKEDLFNLVRRNDKIRNYVETVDLVNDVFTVFNGINDGRLEFKDFAEAHRRNYIAVDRFWAMPSSLSFDMVWIRCKQCAREFLPRAASDFTCDTCISMINPSPRPYLYS
jgi:Ca2+-binding EF-hand superfamily protein